jgi:hypothetical protein
MDKRNGVFLLTCVCVLLVVVAGAVESGKVAGFNYSGGFPFIKDLGINLGTNSTTSTQTNSTVRTQTNSTVSTQTSSTRTGGGKTNGTSFFLNWSFPPILSDFLRVLPAWFLAAVAIMCFGGACVLILRLRTSVSVMNLESTLQEMEQQQKYLEETWSYRLRNAALLRYYLLMRRACLKVGLRDEPAETPQEYVGRVSSFFKVEKSEAARFASAVNKSRYGEELSQLEAGEASKFMSAFADVIRRRAGEGR